MSEALARYVSGALDPSEEAAFEARLFTEETLAREAQRLMRLVATLRAMVAEGAWVPAVLDDELQAYRRRGEVREATPRDGKLAVEIGAADFVCARIPVASGSTGPRVHLEFCTAEGVPYFRVHEAPFDPTSGELIVLCKSHVARAAGDLIVRVVDDDENVLGQAVLSSS